ncbi:MAG TPA: efflux RND transporter periplasmic adaptor subunit [Candidatus Baltobacteraceae bacterium]|nr:efflux RND transporter periplasmic adaptor subunit [Candidatus Baltobacteraceae bacterium]
MRVHGIFPEARALVALLFAVGVGVGLSGCAKSAGGPNGPPPLAVEVGRAERGTLTSATALDGQVVPYLQATLSTTQSATVTAVNVTEGGFVHAGQLLAQLDTSSLRAQLAANEAAVEQAHAHLQSSLSGNPIQSQGYTSAYQGSEQSLQQAQHRVHSDEAALANAELVYKSDQQLFAQGYVSQTTLEQARASDVAAQQELNDSHSALLAAQASLRAAKASLGQTAVDEANTQAMRSALDQATANVALLRTQIAQSSLTAPFDGVVTQRLVDPGAFAGPSQPIVQVSQIDPVYVDVNVPDDVLPNVRKDTPVTFTTASVPGRIFSGTIFDINATPTQGTLSYRARLIEPNADGVLRGGMLVTVQVIKERRRNIVIVPKAALAEGEHGTTVFAVKDGKAVAVPVDVGMETDTKAEVRSPQIQPGTTVITTRSDALQNGSVVAVTNPSAGALSGASSGAPSSK